MKRDYNIGSRIYGSTMEYIGIVSGVAAGISAFEKGWITNVAVVLAGGVLYSIGKIVNSEASRLNQRNVLGKVLEERLKEAPLKEIHL